MTTPSDKIVVPLKAGALYKATKWTLLIQTTKDGGYISETYVNRNAMLGIFIGTRETFYGYTVLKFLHPDLVWCNVILRKPEFEKFDGIEEVPTVKGGDEP